MNPDVLIALTFVGREIDRVMVEDADELACLIAVQKAINEELVAQFPAEVGDPRRTRRWVLNRLAFPGVHPVIWDVGREVQRPGFRVLLTRNGLPRHRPPSAALDLGPRPSPNARH